MIDNLFTYVLNLRKFGYTVRLWTEFAIIVISVGGCTYGKRKSKMV